MRKNAVIAMGIAIAVVVLAVRSGAASSPESSPSAAFADGPNQVSHASNWWGIGSVYAWTLPRRSCWTGLGAGRAVCHRFSR